MRTRSFAAAAALLVTAVPLSIFAAELEKPPTSSLTHQLAEFGPVKTAAELTVTYEKALAALHETGGVLVIPAEAWKQLPRKSLQNSIRLPAPPEETKQWREGPGVTVLTADAKQTIVEVPPQSGLRIQRQLWLNPQESLPHWSTNPAITIDSKLVYGSNSYLDWIQAPVTKGLDRRFYVPTVRGLRPGQFLNIHGGPGYGGGVTRAYVKSVGYDAEKQQHYIVADTTIDHVAGAILHNKNNTGLVHMLQTSHNDNQTYDMKIIRNQYAHGDTYMYYCDFNYMSNVHSAAGDENGNCFAAFIRSLDNNFRGTVEAIDWSQNSLKFAASARDTETLGDSRPLINRNPEKAISAGKVFIVPPQGYFDVSDTRQPPTYAGKQYASGLITHPVTNVKQLRMGGLIRGDRDCPWTPAVVGRFFAVDIPNEKTPKGNYRWYLITQFRENSDGTKEIEIQRFYWGAKDAGSPTLYNRDNYTWDGHERPLGYLIAPGTYVNDVSQAIAGGPRGGKRTLGIVPHSAQGTEHDFAPGDAIEQAIGPDPYKPQAFRVWMWEDVPGAFPSAVFDIANNGAASRYAVLSARGGGQTLEEVSKRQEQKPAWDNFIVLDAASATGINFKGDVTEAAIAFQQPTSEQPIKWRYQLEGDEKPQVASLTVGRESGQLKFAGRGVDLGGAASGVTGLSGETTPARNLRDKNVKIAGGSKTLQVMFAHAEADASYAVFVEQSWLTNRAIGNKTADGFTITFADAAPEGATIDWMIVR